MPASLVARSFLPELPIAEPIVVTVQPIRFDAIEPPAFEIVATPDVAHAEPDPAVARGEESKDVEILLDAAPAEPVRLKPVRERAVKIVARVQDEQDAPRHAGRPQPGGSDEWTRDVGAASKAVTERLGPLARWARSEPVRKPKPTAVTADDVRALISSLAVPHAVAWVAYPRGCRIRRVRVPPAPEAESAEAVGAVILSRRILAEQREKRPTA